MISPVIAGIAAAVRAAGGVVLETPTAIHMIVAVGPASDPGEHMTLTEAAAAGKLRSTRPLKEAGRAGAITLYGTERTRTVKRGEFAAWLESRRAPVAKVRTDQQGRVEARLAAAKRKKKP